MTPFAKIGEGPADLFFCLFKTLVMYIKAYLLGNHFETKQKSWL